ncbi:MAG: hypothetical protein WCF10_00365 [Polyangiales bacterium]
MEHTLYQLDIAIGSLNVNGGAAQPHSHPELRLEHPQVRAPGTGELEQKAGIGDFDVGGYIGLSGAALRNRFDTLSLARLRMGREP